MSMSDSLTKYHPYSKPDEVETFKFALLRRVAFYCLWLHVGLIGVFWHVEVPTLAIVNVFSVALWYSGIKLIDRAYYSLALRIFCFEVALHATLVCALLGMKLGFQYYLWTVSCLMLLDYQLRLRNAVLYSLHSFRCLPCYSCSLMMWFINISIRSCCPTFTLSTS